jgi:hypothetical protein
MANIVGGVAQLAKDRISSSTTLLKRAVTGRSRMESNQLRRLGKAWAWHENPIKNIDCSLQSALHDHLTGMAPLVP